jgi:hypothetical protein
VINPHVWIAVYVDLAFVQFAMYASNRRYNVSPHEDPGSSGAAGMCMSVMAAPIYVVAFVQSALGRSSSFVVTPKGGLRSADRLSTFRLHLGWAAMLLVALALSFGGSRPESSMRLWSAMLVAVCLTPLAISLSQRFRLWSSMHEPVSGARRLSPGAPEGPPSTPTTEAA